MKSIFSRVLGRLRALFRGYYFFDPPEPFRDPPVGVRQPKGSHPGSRGSAVALAEPDDDRAPVHAIGRTHRYVCAPPRDRRADRGKFSSPRGHPGSAQEPRRYSTTRVISSSDNASPNAGRRRLSARARPPRWTTADQSRSASGVVKPRQHEAVKDRVQPCRLRRSCSIGWRGEPIGHLFVRRNS